MCRRWVEPLRWYLRSSPHFPFRRVPLFLSSSRIFDGGINSQNNQHCGTTDVLVFPSSAQCLRFVSVKAETLRKFKPAASMHTSRTRTSAAMNLVQVYTSRVTYILIFHLCSGYGRFFLKRGKITICLWVGERKILFLTCSAALYWFHRAKNLCALLIYLQGRESPFWW